MEDWKKTECIDKRWKRPNGRSTSAKYYWVTRRGPIPSNLNVCHYCDNPWCCNLDHMWLGTQKENLRDMKNKGRGKKKTQIR